MRMKFNKSGQLLLVSAASLLVAGLVTACGTLTVDFVFVTSSKAAGPNNYGEVNVFEVNSESGFMRQIPTSPFPSGGRNPVAEAVSTDHTSLYVVNQDDNTIVQFIIGNDGKLYPETTTNTPGIFPMAVAVAGSSLFVVDTYQPLPTCSTAAPCSGSVAAYPIQAAIGTGSTATPAGTLGTPASNAGLNYWPLALTGAKTSADVLAPTGITALSSGAEIFVTAYDTTANAGYVFAFTVGTGGVLTPVAGSPWATGAGTHPSAAATDPTGTYLYVTDSANGNVLAYTVASGAKLPGSPFAAGNQPSAIVIDPTAGYAFVANAGDSTVTAYTTSNGALTSAGTFTTGLQPVAIGLDPSKNHFLYTANFLGNNVSGFELTNINGPLINTQNTPYASNAQPTAVTAIPHK
jgi:6-phosphogluconolactonase (cycloisomerase 2 family)